MTEPVGELPETGSTLSPAAFRRLPVHPLSSTQLAIVLNLFYACLARNLTLSCTWLTPVLDVVRSGPCRHLSRNL